MKRTASLAFCIILSLTAHPRPLARVTAGDPGRAAQTAGEFQRVAAGVERLRVVRGDAAERWTINVLRLDLSRVDITAAREGFGPDFADKRHPRTAVARDRAGRVLFVTVDGRQPGVSVGMTLEELARLLLEFDAAEAINLDGGGSTTMVIDGKVVNSPSDREGERPVSDAILIMPRGRAPAAAR
jgi:hypothetical protein